MSAPSPPIAGAAGPLYKLYPDAASAACTADALPWAEVDERDGFVHLSAADQVRETARLYFASAAHPALVTVDPGRVPAGTLRWERSRGGAWFPHVYGPVPRDAVVRVDELARDPGGVLEWPFFVPAPLGGRPDPGEVVARLERSATAAMLGLADAALALGLPVECMLAASALAYDFGPGSPWSGTRGLGMGGTAVDEVPDAALDRLEELFDARETPATIELSSHTDPGWFERLHERGYRLLHVDEVLVRALEPATAGEPAAGGDGFGLAAIAEGDGPALDRTAHALSRGFADADADADVAPWRDVARVLLRAAGMRTYSVTRAGAAVGTASLRIEHELAWLAGATIAAEHGGRGGYGACVALRAAEAAQLGAGWLAAEVPPGSAVHGALRRRGFTPSHTRLTWRRGA
jgi:uncharacterized protein (DUF952 family)